MRPDEMIERRARRCIAAVLGAKDDLVGSNVSDEDADELRRVILNELNDFAQYAAAAAVGPSDELLRLVTEIHETVHGDG